MASNTSLPCLKPGASADSQVGCSAETGRLCFLVMSARGYRHRLSPTQRWYLVLRETWTSPTNVLGTPEDDPVKIFLPWLH
jgi:hypothetical protein